jgi:dihydroorotase
MQTLIKHATIINEGQRFIGSILIDNHLISKVITEGVLPKADRIIDAEGKLLIPGMIDDQVHFREPGLTHKAEIYTEAKAAVAGGITSFMEMPNTVPQAVTIEELEKKYTRAAECSLANYSFFLGTTNNNIEEIKRLDTRSICGVKIFMGSSTGDMVVDLQEALEETFQNAPSIIATHCEDDAIIAENQAEYEKKYSEDIPFEYHPLIRSREDCLASSKKAIDLAQRNDAKLHILHISTRDELDLFTQGKMSDKQITAEACVHHLYFTDEDYKTKGAFIKWNPAVKEKADRDAIREAVMSDKIDVIATDHAPHTYEEKSNPYTSAPSGGPLVQHALSALFELCDDGIFTYEKVVEKIAHNPAMLFNVQNRGFIREGYFADLVLIDTQRPYTVENDNILYKCGWSPFEGHTFDNQVIATFVNGHLAYIGGEFDESQKGMRLTFDR